MDRNVIKGALADWRALRAEDEDELDDPAILKGLGERQEDYAEALLEIVGDQGKWGQDDGPDGANYFPTSPFAETDTDCDDCIFYVEEGGVTGSCQLVAGTIDSDGWCHLFVRTPGRDDMEDPMEPAARMKKKKKKSTPKMPMKMGEPINSPLMRNGGY